MKIRERKKENSITSTMKNKHRIFKEDYIIEEEVRILFVVNLLLSVKILHIE